MRSVVEVRHGHRVGAPKRPPERRLCPAQSTTTAVVQRWRTRLRRPPLPCTRSALASLAPPPHGRADKWKVYPREPPCNGHGGGRSGNERSPPLLAGGGGWRRISSAHGDSRFQVESLPL